MLCEKQKLRSSVIATICIMLVSAVLPAKLQADTVTEEWVAMYNSQANDNDEAQAIALDALGNVYVTGFSFGSDTDRDYATVKYDSYGNELWVARYNGLADKSDYPADMAVDPEGNVYVTGSCYDGPEGPGNTSYNYATVKYNTNGNELWVARYNGPPGNGYDAASALALDASGNVYVTGESRGLGTYLPYDYATIKYDSSGNQLWVARYNGPANNERDEPHDIAVDASGNVYVTGFSYNDSNDVDYATVKYDSSGNQLWVARYDGSINRHDLAYAIAVDTSGNVYVSGRSDGNSTAYDYATIKYDSSGNQLWVARYNGPGNSDEEYVRAITVDDLGNVYVTGHSMSSDTNRDYVTVKYDSSGNELWVAIYNSPGNYDDWAYDMAIDGLGNVYVAGMSGSTSNQYDATTVKYDSSGNQLWVARYNGPANKWDRAQAITLDPLGDVYVTGYSYSNDTAYDYATVKYSQVPNQLPIADAGSDQALLQLGTTVNLDGSQSYDLEGDALTYYWTMIEEPVDSAAALSNPASAWPSFVADVYGDYIIELVVSDPWNPSDPDTIKVSFDNIKPVAEAGDNQAVIVGDTVNLDGGGSSDINGDELTYSWILEAVPAGSQTVLFDACTETPSFVTDEAGTYVVNLIVNDGLLDGDVDTVSIEVISRYDGLIQILLELIEKVNLLPDESLKNKNLKNALTNKINEVLAMVDEGLYVDARNKLQNDILDKTNGCAEIGEPDKNDWITTCPEQGQVYPLVMQAIELLEDLI